MNNIIKLSVAMILLIGNIANSNANDLNDLLAKAYGNSDTIAQQKLQFKSAIEQYTAVLSTFLPTVQYNMNFRDNHQFTKDSGLKQSSVLEARLPLFNGGGSIANLKAAKALVDVGKAKWHQAEQEYLLSSINTYIEYYTTLETYAVSNSSVNSTGKQYEAATEKLKLGEATKTEVAAAQAQYTKALAERSSIYSKLVSSKLKFNNLFGDVGASKSNIEAPKIAFNNSKELAKAMLNNNYEYKQAQSNIIANKYKVYASASQLAPTISGSIEYQNVQEFVMQPLAGTYTTTIQVNVPIFHSQTNVYSATRQARNTWKSSQLHLMDVLKKLKEKAGELCASYEASKLTVKYSKEAMIAAQLVYDGTIQEEAVGNKSMLDVLDAESGLYKAKTQYLDRKQQYIILAYQIKSLTGDLTAKALGLKVDIFDPDLEFKKLSSRMIGF